jgi:hypothetical protein
MTFTEALEQCKLGAKIARTSWNGKGQFVFYSDETVVEIEALSTKTLYDWAVREHKNAIDFCPGLDSKAADDVVQVSLLMTKQDMLANDWVIV